MPISVPFTLSSFRTSYEYYQTSHYARHYPPRYPSPSLVTQSHHPTNTHQYYCELEETRRQLGFSLEKNDSSSSSMKVASDIRKVFHCSS